MVHREIVDSILKWEKGNEVTISIAILEIVIEVVKVIAAAAAATAAEGALTEGSSGGSS